MWVSILGGEYNDQQPELLHRPCNSELQLYGTSMQSLMQCSFLALEMNFIKTKPALPLTFEPKVPTPGGRKHREHQLSSGVLVIP